MDALTLLCQGPIMPVIIVNDATIAVDLAHALVAGGIQVLEVTLRTKAALAAIRRIRDQVPDAIVGGGTLLTPQHIDEALDAGAQFGISPGLTQQLITAAQLSGLTFIPGVATPSEAMRAQNEGFTVQKLFPAEAVGGIRLLKALAGPLPELRFCPTGGIDINNAQRYLALPNVPAVGGSWIVPEDAIVARDWNRITSLAKAASQLRSRIMQPCRDN